MILLTNVIRSFRLVWPRCQDALPSEGLSHTHRVLLLRQELKTCSLRIQTALVLDLSLIPFIFTLVGLSIHNGRSLQVYELI